MRTASQLQIDQTPLAPTSPLLPTSLAGGTSDFATGPMQHGGPSKAALPTDVADFGKVFPMFYDQRASSLYKTAQDIPLKSEVYLPTLQAYMRQRTIRTALDIGCGAGYFTVPMSELAGRVVGLDNSAEILKIADTSRANVKYQLGDVFSTADDFPTGIDFAFAPFMTGYASSVADLGVFARKSHASLNPGGTMLLVSPNGRSFDDRRWGFTVEGVEGQAKDGTQVIVRLYDKDAQPFGPSTIPNTYFSLGTIESTFGKAGFVESSCVEPVVSRQAEAALGPRASEQYKRENPYWFLLLRAGVASPAAYAGPTDPGSVRPAPVRSASGLVP